MGMSEMVRTSTTFLASSKKQKQKRGEMVRSNKIPSGSCSAICVGTRLNELHMLSRVP